MKEQTQKKEENEGTEAGEKGKNVTEDKLEKEEIRIEMGEGDNNKEGEKILCDALVLKGVVKHQVMK